MTIFSAGELADLFDDSAYGREKYTEPAPSDELVAEVEAELGYRLPAAYVELCRTRNGGTAERSTATASARRACTCGRRITWP